jgi:hypothetical protein
LKLTLEDARQTQEAFLMTRYLVRSILVLVLLLAGSTLRAQSFTYVSVDVPNAIRTRAFGISPGGVIVGDYLDSSHVLHGFVLAGGQYITLDAPGSLIGLSGALQTLPRGISPAGDIVGAYFAAPGSVAGCTLAGSPPCIKGFLLHRGMFSTVLFPGHEGAIPQRITPDGSIYGCYHDTDLMRTMFGFVRSPSGFSAITVPASMHTGATPDNGTVVGLYTDMMVSPAVTHGYVIENGNFQSFDVPNSTFTQAWDINPASSIVGDFKDSAGMPHGFLRTAAGYISIDFPAATASHAFGINAEGAIVGTYTDVNGATHGFLAVANFD